MALLTRVRRKQDQAQGGIAAEISGEVSGQVAVGSNIVQVTAQHGAVVNVAAPAQAVRITARATPAAIRPRDFPDLLGRAPELELAHAALADGLTVEFHGAAGVGKTALLRYLCHHGTVELEHGIVFLRAAGSTVEDLAQALFEALYETDGACKPTPIQLRQHLADRRALVVLDDLACERDELVELLDCAPGCLFLLSAERRCLWGEGRAHELEGLGSAAALALLEQELARPLAPAERTRAEELCRLLDGRPLSVLQAAALAREGELPLGGREALEDSVRAHLDPSEQRALGVLELLAPAAVHADDVGAIADVPAAAGVLARLASAGAAAANSPHWSTTLATDSNAGPGDGELVSRAIQRLTANADERPTADVPAIGAALTAGTATRQWKDVIAGARASDRMLTVTGCWGAWGAALAQAHEAALASGDRSSTAWALHQQGTRAGCLGDLDAARPLLNQALALRRELGEERSAAVTEHNIATFFGPGGGVPDPRRPTALLLALGALVLLGLGGATALVVGSSTPHPRARSIASATTETNPATTTTTTPHTTTHGGSTSPPPQLDAKPPRLIFDATPLDHTAYRSLTVMNTTSAPIAFVVRVEGTGFALVRSDCPTESLVATETCTVEVSFTPHEPGIHSGAIDFTGTATRVPLTGYPATSSTPTTTPTIPTTTTTVPMLTGDPTTTAPPQSTTPRPRSRPPTTVPRPQAGLEHQLPDSR